MANGGTVTFKFDADTKGVKQGTKEVKDEVKETGNSVKDIVKGIAIEKIVESSVSACINSIKTIGSAFVSIGKQALDSYSDYEQLAGGIETLFGATEEDVKNYAEVYGMTEEEVRADNDIMKSSINNTMYNASQAYKTAGLSANDYMEAVMGFSASLKQSLNGDTQAMSDYADRAVTDMADNANKMGTSMSLIQNAYQGFAKQNYTMLDNLKLGYGGTKEEMERLITDASKMTDIQDKLNVTVADGDLSFGNIVNAISVMQESLGIAGTTSSEAASTIEGSVNMMKASWSNLITGIADDTVDFDSLINNFVDSIITVGNNVLPRIGIIIDGVFNLIEQIGNVLIQNMPTILQKGMELMQKLLNGIMEALPQLIPILVQLITDFSNFIIQNLPTIIQLGIQLLISLINGLAQALPDLIPQLVDTVLLIVDTLIDNIDLIIDAGITLLIALAEGIGRAIPTLVEKIPTIIQKLVEAITRNLPKLASAGWQIIISLINGIVQGIPQLSGKAKTIINNIASGLISGLGKFGDIGKDIVNGLWNGISNMKTWVINKVKGLGSSILSGIKGVLGIHSPSVEFAWVGQMSGEGYIEGLEDMSSSIQDQLDSTFSLNPQMIASANQSYSPSVNVYNNVSMETDPLGQVVSSIKTFSGGAKNDYNYGM